MPTWPLLQPAQAHAQAEAWAGSPALQPNAGQSWNNLAIALYYQGKTKDAIAAMEKAPAQSSDSNILNNLRALRGGK